MKMFPQILVNVRYTAGSGDPLEHESVKAFTAELKLRWATVDACCCVNPAPNR